jgi:hypothetical protein
VLAWTLVVACMLTFRATQLLQHISPGPPAGSLTLSRKVSELRDVIANRVHDRKDSQSAKVEEPKSVAVHKNGENVAHAVVSVEPQLQALERAVASLFPLKSFGPLRLLDETGLPFSSVPSKVYVLRERELWVWAPPLLTEHHSEAFNRSLSFADGRSVLEIASRCVEIVKGTAPHPPRGFLFAACGRCGG